ncbi:hypothetical protein CONLIGDRAFT_572297, partial [Coniochaeta ligniaria NRRL 30616]
RDLPLVIIITFNDYSSVAFLRPNGEELYVFNSKKVVLILRTRAEFYLKRNKYV